MFTTMSPDEDESSSISRLAVYGKSSGNEMSFSATSNGKLKLISTPSSRFAFLVASLHSSDADVSHRAGAAPTTTAAITSWLRRQPLATMCTLIGILLLSYV